jgi:hypothetical protein
MCLKAQQLYTCDLPNLGQSRRMAVCPLSLVPHARDWRSLSACTVHTFHISVQSIHIACQCNSYLPGCSILQVVCVSLVQELSRRLPRPPPGQSPGGSLCVFSNARTVCQLAESSALRSAWHCFQQATNMGHRRQLRRGSWRHRLQRDQRQKSTQAANLHTHPAAHRCVSQHKHYRWTCQCHIKVCMFRQVHHPLQTWQRNSPSSNLN